MVFADKFQEPDDAASTPPISVTAEVNIKGRTIRYLGGGPRVFVACKLFFYLSGKTIFFFWRSTSDNFFFMFSGRNEISFFFFDFCGDKLFISIFF